GRGRENAAGPAMAEGAEEIFRAVPDMGPEGFVERIETALLILVFERQHFLQQIRMTADRALAENDQVARQDIRAFHRDADRDRAIEIAEIILRPVDHRLTGMNVHG